MLFLSREGIKYGIYFIMTATTQNSVRYRITQNFKQFVMLQMNDEADYSAVFGKTDGLYPAKLQGRGLVKREMIFEFQTAAVSKEESVFNDIQKKCRELRSSWKGACAEPIPVLPDIVDHTFAAAYLRHDTPWVLPVGVDKNTLKVQYLDFSARKADIVLSQDDSYTSIISMLTKLLVTSTDISVMIFDPEEKLDLEASAFSPEVLQIFSGPDGCRDGIKLLFDETVRRFQAHKAATAENQPLPEFKKLMMMFVSMGALTELFRDFDSNDEKSDCTERLNLIMDKMQTVFEMHALIADNVKSVSKYSFNTWFKSQITEGDGLWIGPGVTEQYQLKSSYSDSGMRAPVMPPLGYVFQKGKAVLCKMLAEGSEETDG